MFDTNLNKILGAGLARIEYRKAIYRDAKFTEDTKDTVMKNMDNVVKIDFGKKQ